MNGRSLDPSMKNVGVYFLNTEHAAEMQRLASDPAIVAATRLRDPHLADDAQRFIQRQLEERAEGSAYVFVIKDRASVVGVCGLLGLAGDRPPELDCWIGRAYWGKGYATFGVKMVLEFAFKNLGLARVQALILETNGAARRMLEKNHFQRVRIEAQPDPLLPRPLEQQAVYQITRRQWIDGRNGPALAALHPALQRILAAEIAAGNEIAETGGGWPDADSVFVRLRHPFRTRPIPVPDDVIYTELNDPHWWQAEYGSRSPRHILAC